MTSTNWTPSSVNSTNFTDGSVNSTDFTDGSVNSTNFTDGSVNSTDYTKWADMDNTVTLADTTYLLNSTVVLMTGELNTATPTYKNTVNWS